MREQRQPPSNTHAGVFLSYRRTDSGPSTGRLADDLRDYYGSDRVFHDVQSEVPGPDYIEQIDRALEHARVVVAIIGPTWEHELQKRRGSHDDQVRRELATALASGMGILVVLVGGARVPPSRALPSELEALTRMHALKLTDEDWSYGLGRLLEALESHGLYARNFATGSAVESGVQGIQRLVVGKKHYERTFRATRRRAWDALLGAIEGLGYKVKRANKAAVEVAFVARGRDVSAKILDGAAGETIVVVEFRTVTNGALAAIIFFACGVAAFIWPVLRAWEYSFAKGFMDNVQGVLEGRGVIEDSTLPLGIGSWLKKRRGV